MEIKQPLRPTVLGQRVFFVLHNINTVCCRRKKRVQWKRSLIPLLLYKYELPLPWPPTPFISPPHFHRCSTKVPVGVPGRMWIAGPTLAIGYLNMPERTAERFVPDPFAAAAGREGERMYDTGDRCRYLQSGSIEVIGRCDYMVKVQRDKGIEGWGVFGGRGGEKRGGDRGQGALFVCCVMRGVVVVVSFWSFGAVIRVWRELQSTEQIMAIARQIRFAFVYLYFYLFIAHTCVMNEFYRYLEFMPWVNSISSSCHEWMLFRVLAMNEFCFELIPYLVSHQHQHNSAKAATPSGSVSLDTPAGAAVCRAVCS